ncbi:MAG: hypothetical protein WCX32_04565, partial [Clostridia bacterium]
IYKKYNINRFRWLDESYACFLDGHIADMPTEKFNNIITKLILHQLKSYLALMPKPQFYLIGAGSLNTEKMKRLPI